MNTIEKLLTLTADRFQVPKEKLHPDDDIFDALQLDSFQALELLSELERAFNIQIPDYEMQKVRTFRQLSEVIKKRM